MRKISLFLALLVGLFVAGCTSQDEKHLAALTAIREKAVKACIANGGVPIIGYWSGMVDSCEYPPKEE